MEQLLLSIIGAHYGGIDEALADNLPKGASIAIIKKEADALYEDKRANATSCDRRLISICGLPASGKSYLCKKKLRQKQYFYLSFDEIMESLSYYKRDWLESKEDAFNRWEIPARIIGYQWLSKLSNENISIVFEHSNAVPQHIAMYQILQFIHQYTVKIYYIDTPPEIIENRLAARRRHFPLERVRERWKTMTRLLPAYAVIADEFHTIRGWREQ